MSHLEDIFNETAEVAEGRGSSVVIGITEIAKVAGVKPDTVQKWRKRHSDFPQPVVELAVGPLWLWADIKEWLAKERKPGRPPTTTTTRIP